MKKQDDVETGIKQILVSIPYESYLKLKKLCYDGQSVSYMAKKAILNFIDRSEKTLNEND